MSRVVLVHWKEEECGERAARLERAGHEVSCFTGGGAAGLRGLREDPPAAFVIDLARTPSQGRELGVWLRQQKATRRVPLVFVAGDAAKTARVRKLLPDAVFTTWPRVRGALTRALRAPPSEPVVPGTFDSYAGTPLAKKLGIRAGSVVALLGAPAGFDAALGRLPAGARVRRQARGRAGVVLLFARSLADLDRRFLYAARAVAEGGRLWICWPKRASGVRSDLTQRVVREYGLARGFVDYKIGALDATWSGLCFARRSGTP